MKYKYTIMMGSFFIILAALVVFIAVTRNYVDTSFATEVSLKYYYNEIQMDVVVTNENDISIIKENLNGVSHRDNPSCGFSRNISITFSDGEKELVLCPACDSCSIAQIGDSNRYVSIKDRKVLETVLKKYDIHFPCV